MFPLLQCCFYFFVFLFSFDWGVSTPPSHNIKIHSLFHSPQLFSCSLLFLFVISHCVSRTQPGGVCGLLLVGVTSPQIFILSLVTLGVVLNVRIIYLFILLIAFFFPFLVFDKYPKESVLSAAVQCTVYYIRRIYTIYLRFSYISVLLWEWFLDSVGGGSTLLREGGAGCSFPLIETREKRIAHHQRNVKRGLFLRLTRSKVSREFYIEEIYTLLFILLVFLLALYYYYYMKDRRFTPTPNSVNNSTGVPMNTTPTSTSSPSSVPGNIRSSVPGGAAHPPNPNQAFSSGATGKGGGRRESRQSISNVFPPGAGTNIFSGERMSDLHGFLRAFINFVDNVPKHGPQLASQLLNGVDRMVSVDKWNSSPHNVNMGSLAAAQSPVHERGTGTSGKQQTLGPEPDDTGGGGTAASDRQTPGVGAGVGSAHDPELNALLRDDVDSNNGASNWLSMYQPPHTSSARVQENASLEPPQPPPQVSSHWGQLSQAGSSEPIGPHGIANTTVASPGVSPPHHPGALKAFSSVNSDLASLLRANTSQTIPSLATTVYSPICSTAPGSYYGPTTTGRSHRGGRHESVDRSAGGGGGAKRSSPLVKTPRFLQMGEECKRLLDVLRRGGDPPEAASNAITPGVDTPLGQSTSSLSMKFPPPYADGESTTTTPTASSPIANAAAAVQYIESFIDQALALYRITQDLYDKSRDSEPELSLMSLLPIESFVTSQPGGGIGGYCSPAKRNAKGFESSEFTSLHQLRQSATSPPRLPPGTGGGPSPDGFRRCQRHTLAINGTEYINEYRILKIVGYGATSKVRLGLQTTTKKQVAIKSIMLRTQSTQLFRRGSMERSSSDTSSTKFNSVYKAPELSAAEIEIRILRRLAHPYVVCLKEVIEDDDENSIHLVLDYASHGAVSTVQKYDDKLRITPVDVVRPFHKLARYMQETMERHLDRSHVTSNGSDRMSVSYNYMAHQVHQFGPDSSLFIQHGVDSSGRVVDKAGIGTPAFAAPELLGQNDCTTHSDVWSLGVVLFGVLFGRLPFSARTLRETIDEVLSKELEYPRYEDVPGAEGSAAEGPLTREDYREWVGICKGMLQRLPEDRPALRLLLKHRFFQFPHASLQNPHVGSIGKAKAKANNNNNASAAGKDAASPSRSLEELESGSSLPLAAPLNSTASSDDSPFGPVPPPPPVLVARPSSNSNTSSSETDYTFNTFNVPSAPVAQPPATTNPRTSMQHVKDRVPYAEPVDRQQHQQNFVDPPTSARRPPQGYKQSAADASQHHLSGASAYGKPERNQRHSSSPSSSATTTTATAPPSRQRSPLQLETIIGTVHRPTGGIGSELTRRSPSQRRGHHHPPHHYQLPEDDADATPDPNNASCSQLELTAVSPKFGAQGVLETSFPARASSAAGPCLHRVGVSRLSDYHLKGPAVVKKDLANSSSLLADLPSGSGVSAASGRPPRLPDTSPRSVPKCATPTETGKPRTHPQKMSGSATSAVPTNLPDPLRRLSGLPNKGSAPGPNKGSAPGPNKGSAPGPSTGSGKPQTPTTTAWAPMNGAPSPRLTSARQSEWTPQVRPRSKAVFSGGEAAHRCILEIYHGTCCYGQTGATHLVMGGALLVGPGCLSGAAVPHDSPSNWLFLPNPRPGRNNGGEEEEVEEFNGLTHIVAVQIREKASRTRRNRQTNKHPTNNSDETDRSSDLTRQEGVALHCARLPTPFHRDFIDSKT
eukprot:gene892-521_t